MVDLSIIDTEKRNPRTTGLDQMSALEIATAMNQGDRDVVAAVQMVLPEISLAIDLATKALKEGGRIIYIGAGTSGRLGVLDAAECPPTFGVTDNTVIGLMAGGADAILKAIEGAEDDVSSCEEDLKSHDLSSKDLVVGLSASGRTPYVVGGLKYAGSIGCNTVSIACSKNSEIGKSATVAIEVATGPEILTGSTRLKAGTAQKMILNMISTGSMVGVGKVYQNLMVDVQPTNEKLKVRSRNMVMEVTGCSSERADEVLTEAGGEVKTAIVMLLLDLDLDEAKKKLKESGGVVRCALEQ